MDSNIQPTVYLAMSNSLLICPNDDSSATMWDINTNSLRGVLRWEDGEDHAPLYWAVDAAGKTAISIHDWDIINAELFKIWDLETNQQKLSVPTPGVNFPCFLDSTTVMLGTRGGPIEVWEIGNNSPVRRIDLVGHTGKVNKIKAGYSNLLSLSCSDDKTLRLWDMRTFGCVRVMQGHSKRVKSVDWDSGFKAAVSGSKDNTIKQWDLGSGRCVDTYMCDEPVIEVIMHQSGSSFLSLEDGSINYDFKDFTSVLKSWAMGCSSPLMTIPLVHKYQAGYPCTYWVAASSDHSCVALCSPSDASFSKIEVWKWYISYIKQDV